MAAKPQTIAGVVRDQRGRFVSQARVYLKAGPVSLPDIAALTNDRGELSLPAPAPGNYELACSADGFATALVKVAVKPGQETKVDVQLRPETG
jgi:hypothetical protein